MLESIVVWVSIIFWSCIACVSIYGLTCGRDGRYAYFSKIWKRKEKQQFDFYLAGPMRNYKNKNKDMFLKVATLLREQGYTIFNPGEVNDDALTFQECMNIDLDAVVNRCANIAFLPDWKQSLGSNAEVFVAFVCGKSGYQTRLVKKGTEVRLKRISLKRYRLPYGVKKKK
ncbi:hypothetical protein LCGC14_1045900 [marine sediment metagenome]|uniref:DUF4406 domain-containing protein n=1 Tax=marine sediment metagenome TaxID=412755 RepID=A0A0F9MQC6_9ZZZZ